jgi:predicted transcriptional regulator
MQVFVSLNKTANLLQYCNGKKTVPNGDTMTMINFSCTNIPVFEVLRCSWNLTKTELQILRGLSDTKTTADVKEEHDVSMSLAQRSMKALYDKDLVERQQVNQRQGGYIFVYSRKSRDELVNDIKHIIDDWSARAKEAVANEAFEDVEEEHTVKA